ncbi:MAG: sensor histidine kinase [Oleiphilus sp.]|nr:MAG: sensor histidine kinase [Oleiphilus sp.]
MKTEDEQPDFSLIIASAVHDMKNSLGMLLHSVDNLCEELPEETRAQLNTSTILYEAERVNSFLVQLLGLYRLQNHKLTLSIDEHFLSDLLDEHKAQYQEVFDHRNITLEIDTDPSLAWYFDRELILGVVNNALNNASRYTREKIILSAYEAEGELVIEVHDDGEGYPDAMLEADPGDIKKNINFKTGSTSLGLYFASKVAGLHKESQRSGRIAIANGGKLGGGVFSVYLP